MKTYKLYLESGPRKKKTMVHVPGILGCMANGPTTETALSNTPDAIREFHFFLYRYGGTSNSDIEFSTEIAAHIMKGVWLGNGDPSIVLDTDLEPLSKSDVEIYISHLDWMGRDMLDLAAGLTAEKLVEKPQPHGRTFQKILEHVLESEYSYMYAFGRITELPASGAIIEKRDRSLLDWIQHVREKEFKRLRALTDKERNQPFIHWKYTRTARKVLRRILEHQWEHLAEMRSRLDK